jgi:propanol-preferring alcohol dehydrogenase
MKGWAVVQNEAPLQYIELADPEVAGSDVLLEVTHCGVCHSDLHFWHGVHSLGGGRVIRLKDNGVTLPRAPGHEVAARVVAVGPDVEGVALGEHKVVYPWIGCGLCAPCLAEQDHLCLGARQTIGVRHDGGFGSLVKVPHPRYLVDYGDIDPGLAATYACSGITTYSAVKKIMPLAADSAVVLLGAGGLGLAAISMLRAFGHEKIISVDIRQDKLDAALQAGASAVVDGSKDLSGQKIIDVAGGPVAAAIDFVNTSQTAEAGFNALRKGGTLVLVGMAGGEMTISTTGMVFRALSVQGSGVGSPQDLRDVLAMARDGRLQPTPVERFARNAANEVLERLERGEIMGRAILTDMSC